MNDSIDTPLQFALLNAALDLIRQRVPDASIVHLSTSDQNYYGFLLDDVEFPDGTTLSETNQRLLDLLSGGALDEYLGDLDWDGVVGEDSHGIAHLALHTHEYGATPSLTKEGCHQQHPA